MLGFRELPTQPYLINADFRVSAVIEHGSVNDVITLYTVTSLSVMKYVTTGQEQGLSGPPASLGNATLSLLHATMFKKCAKNRREHNCPFN